MDEEEIKEPDMTDAPVSDNQTAEEETAEEQTPEEQTPEEQTPEEQTPETPAQGERVQSRSFFLGVLAGLLFAALLTTGTLFGRQLYVQQQVKKAQEAAQATDATQSTEPASVVNQKTLSKMQTVEKLIKEHYYLNEVDEQTLSDGVCAGMMSAVGDKYSRYYSAQELKDEQEDSQGVYYGIGAYLGTDEKTTLPYISGILMDEPAGAAGLREGDIVYQVDGKSTYQMDLEDVVKLVKGKEGTKVTLSILRGNDKMDIEVTRAKIKRETVTSRMLDHDIGYIGISEFDSVTVDQFTENYAEIEASNPKGLILDLRGNPGGLLSSVVSIAQEILPEGKIVYTKDKQGKEETYLCDGKREIKIPLVVLVNGGSASAAEILTGAVKDYGIGTIVGTRTFGKGIVQMLYPLSDGSAVKMTVSAYYTPKGTNIQGTGIEPNVKVELDTDAYYNSDGKQDNQLDKAIEVIQEKLK